MTDGAPLDRITTELGLAVELVDTYGEGPPRGRPRVAVTNADAEFRRTPGGYFVLVDLPDDPGTLDVVVESDRYLREERAVERGSLDPDEPLYTIDLVPAPAYEFGGGVTLVRGTVEEDDEPVPGATVSYLQGSAVTWSDDVGEFVLPLRDFAPDDVVADDGGTRTVEPAGQLPTFEAAHPDDDRTTERDVTVAVGGTASVYLDF